MKKILCSALLLLSLNSIGQVTADPALSQMKMSSLQNVALDITNLPINDVIKLKVPVLNKNINNALPSGTCKIKVGLGSKLVMDPAFNLSTVNTSNYFQWTAVLYGGQVQITGDLIAPLPANFSDTATFNIKGSILGNSTITTNFLVTNHNTTTILSDEDPTNNTSFLAYIITEGQGPIPVTFTKIAAAREACNIIVNFDAEREINVSRYDIEVSKNGINYEKVGQLPANNMIQYKYSFPITDLIKSANLYVRVRSVDMDGKYQYSETRSVSGNCDKGWGVMVFPNPVPQQLKQVIVQTTVGSFNGKYKISLLDMTGKLISTKEMTLSNTSQFNVETGNLAAGQYLLKMLSNDGSQSAILKIQKL